MTLWDIEGGRTKDEFALDTPKAGSKRMKGGAERAVATWGRWLGESPAPLSRKRTAGPFLSF